MLLLLLLMPISLLANSPSVVEINNNNGQAFDVVIFKNQEPKTTWKQFINTEGELVKSEEINFQHSGGRQWIKFSIKNSQKNAKTIIIHVDIVYLEYFQYHILDKDSLVYQSKVLNWTTPIAKKPIFDRYFTFPITILPLEEKTVLISLEGSGGILFTPIYLYSPHQFVLEQQKFDTIFYGTTIINLIFISILFLILCLFRRLLYLYLLIYLISYLVYSLNLEGFLANYAPSILGDIKWLAISSITSSIFSFLFLIKLLQEENENNYNFIGKRQIEKTTLLFYITTILLIIFIPYGVYHNKATLFIYYFFLVLSIGSLLWAIVNKSRNAPVFLFVILPPYLLKTFIHLSISEAIHFSFISNFNLYHLKYIIPIYEFFSLGVAAMLILFRNFKNTSNELNLSQLKIIKAVESERQRIARDLHDDLGGTLSAIKGKIANEKVSQEAINLVEQAIEDLRYISRNLSPPELENDGLIISIQNTINRVQNVSKIKFTFINFGEKQRLNQDIKLNIYRIITELINNILKHSKAQNAIVQLIYYKESLQILVEDDGIGIKSEKNNWGIGLKNINSRVEFLGAKLEIDSSAKGTTVIIELPLKVKNNEAQTANSR
ncbi:7TM-DISM domain-containing protein [Emticicia sp. W12TSBA100-4]|uniref:7TM-DISM domain-containing protein n=1 Tax=Emticicia sp. W12TSBA100-4 TaxID=3160965 RepID=UPI0033062514